MNQHLSLTQSLSSIRHPLLSKPLLLLALLLAALAAPPVHAAPNPAAPAAPGDTVEQILKAQEAREAQLKSFTIIAKSEDSAAAGSVYRNLTAEASHRIAPDGSLRRKSTLCWRVDGQGRTRKNFQETYLNANGTVREETGQMIHFFDGTKMVRIAIGKRGLRTVNLDRTDLLAAEETPVGLFLGPTETPLSKLIARALQAKVPIKLESAGGGKELLLTIPDTRVKQYSHQVLLDRAKGYYPLRWESFYLGKQVASSANVPQEWAPGIWFPRQLKRQVFEYKSGQRQVRSELTLQIIKAAFSEKIAEDFFRFEFKDGDTVRDAFSAKPEYTIGKDKELKVAQAELESSARAGGAPASQTVAAGAPPAQKTEGSVHMVSRGATPEPAQKQTAAAPKGLKVNLGMRLGIMLIMILLLGRAGRRFRRRE